LFDPFAKFFGENIFLNHNIGPWSPWSQVSFFQKTLAALTSDAKVLEREEILRMLAVDDGHPDPDGSDANRTDL
jgi:hypothetical protein